MQACHHLLHLHHLALLVHELQSEASSRMKKSKQKWKRKIKEEARTRESKENEEGEKRNRNTQDGSKRQEMGHKIVKTKQNQREVSQSGRQAEDRQCKKAHDRQEGELQ